MSDTMYWDINKSISRNCLFNFIVGNRGAGKTYGAKKFVIDRFLKTGEQFVYVRRYKEELKKIRNFFDDISHTYEDVKLEVKGKQFFINDHLAGCAMALSTSKIEKSTAFPKVSWIIFDEFILDKGYYHYLPDEVTYFLELYETIARTRDNVRVYFLSNALTVTNPYFLYFKLEEPKAKDHIKVKDDILLEYVMNDEFIEFKNKTRFGKLIKGTKYGDYAVNNAFLRDSDTFIKKKSGNCRFLFSFLYKTKTFGLWVNGQDGFIYVSYDVDPNYPFRYALCKADHTPNTILIESLRKYRPFQMFIRAFQTGGVYFESMDIKNMVYEMFAMAQLIK